MNLNSDELVMVVGGTISASFLNSIARLLTTAIEVGRMVGSSIRRIFGKNYC